MAKWGSTEFSTAGYGLFALPNGQLIVAFSTTGANRVLLTSSDPLPIGIYTHVAGIFTGTELQLYVNSMKIASTAYNGDPVFTNNIPVLIGAYNQTLTNATGFIDGSIDDIRIYNRALTETEIQTLFRAPQ